MLLVTIGPAGAPLAGIIRRCCDIYYALRAMMVLLAASANGLFMGEFRRVLGNICTEASIARVSGRAACGDNLLCYYTRQAVQGSSRIGVRDFHEQVPPRIGRH